ncbi:MAG: integron [Lysobacter sp.]|nr:MAG: integron [Lysobacter sp.]
MKIDDLNDGSLWMPGLSRGAPRAVSIALAIVCIGAGLDAIAAKPAEVPVRVGIHEDLDACGSFAEVKGLNPRGDGFLAVRSGPGADYAMRDRLPEGATFYVCGESADGRWISVVYPRKGQTQEQCDVSSPKSGGAYRGPCAYGWVNARWVNILAG